MNASDHFTLLYIMHMTAIWGANYRHGLTLDTCSCWSNIICVLSWWNILFSISPFSSSVSPVNMAVCCGVIFAKYSINFLLDNSPQIFLQIFFVCLWVFLKQENNRKTNNISLYFNTTSFISAKAKENSVNSSLRV